MGRVFSWEEVHEGRIPRLGDFENVVATVTNRLAASPTVAAALICGSVLRGDHTIRSDLDVLVIYPPNKMEGAMKLMRELLIGAAQRYVPIGFIPIDCELAASPDHHLASTFLEHFHLAARSGGIVKGDPFSLIVPHRLGIHDDVRSYLAHKARGFEKGAVTFDTLPSDQALHLIESALHFPIYVARKMLRCFDVATPDGDAKEYVARQYQEHLISGAGGYFQELLAMDREYADVLKRNIARPDEVGYRDTLRNLRTAIPKAFLFARQNLLALR